MRGGAATLCLVGVLLGVAAAPTRALQPRPTPPGRATLRRLAPSLAATPAAAVALVPAAARAADTALSPAAGAVAAPPTGGLVDLPPDSLLLALVVLIFAGVAALQFSLGDVMSEIDNLPPSMGSQAKKERIKSGGFLKQPDSGRP